MQSRDTFVEALRQATPYILDHRGKTCVVYLGSELLDDETVLHHTLQDLLLLHSLGLKLVLAVSLREQFNRVLDQAGVEYTFTHRHRITSVDALPLLAQESGLQQARLQALITRRTQPLTTRALPPILAAGNWVIAQPRGILDGVDFQHDGRVRKVQVKALQQALASDQIPLLMAITPSYTGELFNLNTLEQACTVASALRADKLIILQKREHLPDLPAQLTARELQQRQHQHPLLTQLAQIIGSVRRIHLLDAFSSGALIQELFTLDGSGTLIFADHYHKIRTATIHDIGGILTLIEPLEEAGILVRREREKLEAEIANFLVVVRDNHIIGCAALYPLDNSSAEIACFAIHPDYRNQGIGQALLKALEERAHSHGLRQLFLLTTQAQHWFTQHGFQPSSPDALPEHRQQLYNWQRRARVYLKHLAPWENA